MWVKSFLRRVRGLWHSEAIHREITDELQFHIDMRVEENIRRGMSPDEARRDAERSFGNLTRIKEQGYDVRGGRWLETVWQDLRYGMRMLLKNKTVTLVAVLSLALGIGANTAIFSLLDALLLKTLPVKNSEQLVFVGGLEYHYPPQLDRAMRNIPVPDPVYREMSEKNTVFSGIFTFNQVEVTVNDGSLAEQVSGELVSGNFFTVLGVGAHLGRMFTDDDDLMPGAHFVTVISYNYWRSRFGADPNIVGKKISINTHPFTIIGVSAQGFNGVDVSAAPALRVPMMMKNLMQDPRNDTPVVARLKPGISIEQAQVAADALFQNIIREYSASSLSNRYSNASRIELSHAGRGVSASELRDRYLQPLIFLLCLVGMVLLIACLNVANLLLARAAARRKEIAVRLAVGAGRLRLIRQLLTEGFLLAALGGALGLVFARMGTDLLLGLLPFTREIKLDMRMLGITLVVTILTGVLFGLAPALQATRFELIPALKNDTAGMVGGRRKWELRRLLVALQVALSLVLLVWGGLFVRSLQNLKAVDLGYTSDQIVSMSLALGRIDYKTDQQLSFYQQLSARLTALPGVKSATYTNSMPLEPKPYGKEEGEFEVPGSHSPPNEKPTALMHSITPQFFATFGIPLLRGRDFNWQDSVGRVYKVVIVNDRFARYFFGNENPLGKRISVAGFEFEIVGVVGNARLSSLKETMSRTVYYPAFTALLANQRLCVRARGDTGALIAAIRNEVRRLDPNLPVYDIKTFADQIDESISRERMIALLSSFFGLFALLLAGLGLYGVMAYAVARRTREIGIRMALGAQAGNVLWLVLRETLLLVSIGVAIGLPAALAATRLTRGMLFGLTENDPLTIALATLVMTAIAAMAGYLPARRAAQVDPMIVLRQE
jgi:putative ABC transport system permease protein